MMDLLHCPSCNMSFKSSLLLAKHRERFCIEGDIGKVRETQTPQDMVSIQLQHFDMVIKACNNRVPHKMRKKKHMKRIPKTKWDREHEVHFHYLAEAHSKQLNDILTQNKHLEKQRDDIVQRLNELTVQSKHSDQLEMMIKQLNTQERKNEQLLESLKHQIEMLQIESKRNRNQIQNNDSRVKQKEEKIQPPLQQGYIHFYGGGSLSSEISALRLTYLQNGGNDSMILLHLQDLLTEAQHLEQQGRGTRQPQKKKRRNGTVKHDVNMELITLEIENQCLEDEILKLQLKRQRSAQLFKTSSRKIDLPMFLKHDPKYKMKTLSAEIGLLKQELESQRQRRRMKTTCTQDRQAKPAYSTLPPVEEARPLTPAHTKHFVDISDDLEPAAYDPISGFVVFFDFLLGLDPSYRVCRMVVGLYNNGQEMGHPFSLPAAYCEISSMSTFPENRRQNMAILATKQAIPRIRPSPNFALIMELQASGAYDIYGQEVSHLVSRGWTKMDIFDHQNRVISGHWKIPIRVLPMKPLMTTGEMNAVPQLESAELYVRLVNARDADVQSTIPIDPNNAVFYKYPPLSAACTVFPMDVLHPSFYYYPYYQLVQPTQSLLIDNVDPPPPTAVLMTY
ncbi:coiled-coil domain-containing protein 17 [Microcaecilia unicolor]|uniref:Coiled-coil domain-containing protein 17-like n=1 Tax=Microcaecilia unicolor TaxID=1415580 RepID=A0A6P7X3J9_9AMPH|nr:coiled-coil domain-containing protein 17-like [Microcaecilia unicolor]